MQLLFPTNPALIDADTAELLTCRQTDRQRTFQLHIVDTAAPLLLNGNKV